MKSLPKIIAVLGATMLISGCFMPLFNGPILGGASCALNGRADGITITILAALAMLLALVNLRGWASLAGWLSLAVTGFTFSDLFSNLSEVQGRLHHSFASHPLLGSSVTFGLAWPILFLGAGILIFVGFMQEVQPSWESEHPVSESPEIEATVDCWAGERIAFGYSVSGSTTAVKKSFRPEES